MELNFPFFLSVESVKIVRKRCALTFSIRQMHDTSKWKTITFSIKCQTIAKKDTKIRNNHQPNLYGCKSFPIPIRLFLSHSSAARFLVLGESNKKKKQSEIMFTNAWKRYFGENQVQRKWIVCSFIVVLCIWPSGGNKKNIYWRQ